ncbi:MAG: hypothetical protein ACYTEZ_00210 [Planctomycetota bacterium]|jgi:hypothetical protein
MNAATHAHACTLLRRLRPGARLVIQLEDPALVRDAMRIRYLLARGAGVPADDVDVALRLEDGSGRAVVRVELTRPAPRTRPPGVVGLNYL